MSTRDRRLLIEARDALQGPEYEPHRELLLSLALGEAREDSTLPVEPPAPPEVGSVTFPLRIFLTDRDGRDHEASLLNRDGAVRLPNDPAVYSCSAAATKVKGSIAENGWWVWRYIDPVTGQERRIDDLRRPGAKQVRRRTR